MTIDHCQTDQIFEKRHFESVTILHNFGIVIIAQIWRDSLPSSISYFTNHTWLIVDTAMEYIEIAHLYFAFFGSPPFFWLDTSFNWPI